MSSELIIYSRPGCHLCDVVKADLEEAARDHGLVLTPRNIQGDAELEAAHGHRIPVVVHDGHEIDWGRVDIQKVRDYLTGVVGVD